MKNFKFLSFIFSLIILIFFIVSVVFFSNSVFTNSQFTTLSSKEVVIDNVKLDSYKKSVDSSLQKLAKFRIKKIKVILKDKKTNKSITETFYQVDLLLKKNNLKLTGSKLPEDAKAQLSALIKAKITPQVLENAIKEIEKEKFKIWHVFNPALGKTRKILDDLSIYDIDLKNLILTVTTTSAMILFSQYFRINGPNGPINIFEFKDNSLSSFATSNIKEEQNKDFHENLVKNKDSIDDQKSKQDENQYQKLTPLIPLIKDYNEDQYQDFLKKEYKPFSKITTKFAQFYKPIFHISTTTMQIIDKKINKDTSPLTLQKFVKIFEESFIVAVNTEMERIRDSSSEEDKSFRSKLKSFFTLEKTKIFEFDDETTLKSWISTHNWWNKEYKEMFSDPKNIPKIKFFPREGDEERNKYEFKLYITDDVPIKKKSSTFDNDLIIGLSTVGGVIIISSLGGFLYWFFKIKK